MSRLVHIMTFGHGKYVLLGFQDAPTVIRDPVTIVTKVIHILTEWDL